MQLKTNKKICKNIFNDRFPQFLAISSNIWKKKLFEQLFTVKLTRTRVGPKINYKKHLLMGFGFGNFAKAVFGVLNLFSYHFDKFCRTSRF